MLSAPALLGCAARAQPAYARGALERAEVHGVPLRLRLAPRAREELEKGSLQAPSDLSKHGYLWVIEVC